MSDLGPLYKVVEVVDGQFEGKLTTGPYYGKEKWNDRVRIYSRLQEARVYKSRLVKQGREAKIIRYDAMQEET